MTTITLSHYTRGKYFGTDDKTVAWSVLVNGSPICAETIESTARTIARKAYASPLAQMRRIVEWDGDTSTETFIEGKLSDNTPMCGITYCHGAATNHCVRDKNHKGPCR